MKNKEAEQQKKKVELEEVQKKSNLINQLMKDYKKQVHNFYRQLQTVEENLNNFTSSNWKAPTLPTIPDLKEATKTFVENKIAITPNLTAIEEELSKTKQKLNTTIDKNACIFFI